MRAVRSDVFRETHQSSRSRDKIGQGKVYYRDTECITKLYLGSRMTDADKKKIEEALAQLARQVRLPEGVCPDQALRRSATLHEHSNAPYTWPDGRTVEDP